MALERLSSTIDLSEKQDNGLCNETMAECSALSSHKQLAIFAYRNNQNTDKKYLGSSGKTEANGFRFLPLNQESDLSSGLDENQVAFKFHQDVVDICMNIYNHSDFLT